MSRPVASEIRAVVRGAGKGLPVRSVTNDELALKVDTTDEWITRRTGIRARRVCSATETTSSLCVLAGHDAIANSGIAPDQIDLIICATVTADRPSPSTACIVQNAVGATGAAAFDVGAACAGFIFAASLAAALMETGRSRNALVIGADTLTKHVDWGDRATCVLFGDAAAAVVLSAETGSDRGIMGTALFSDGSGANLIQVEPPRGKDAGGITMAGAEVFRFAVGAMIEACDKVVSDLGLTMDDIDLFVPHQANLRIIEASAERMGLDMAKVFVNVDRYGNTSGASVPLALCEAVEQGVLKPGMRVMTVGFGAGLVWGANVIVW